MPYITQAQARSMTEEERLDYLTRTVLGEAAGEGYIGMIVVGQVIANRSGDGRWPADPVAVAGQNHQFSTHSTVAGVGNQARVARDYPPTSREYRMARAAIEATVINRTAPDITGGAVQYHTVQMGWPASWPTSIRRHGHIDIGNHRVYPAHPVPPLDIPGAIAQLEFEGQMVGTMLDVRPAGLAPIRPASLSTSLRLQRELNRVASQRADAVPIRRQARAMAFQIVANPFDVGRPSQGGKPIINRPEPAMRESMRNRLRATGTPNMTERAFAFQNMQPAERTMVSTAALRLQAPPVAAAPWGVRQSVAAAVAASDVAAGRGQLVMAGNPNLAGSVVAWLYPEVQGEANQEGKGPRGRPANLPPVSAPGAPSAGGQRQAQADEQRDVQRAKPDAFAGTQAEWERNNRFLSEAVQNSGAAATAAVRVFAGSLVGDRSPINESTFTKREIKILGDAVRRAEREGRDYIGYGDFGEDAPWATGNEGAAQTATNAGSGVANTIGMARFERQPDGSIVITDSYDFNATRSEANKRLGEAGGIPGALMEGFVRNGLMGVGNVIGNMMLPEGEGRPVRIRLAGSNQSSASIRRAQRNEQRSQPRAPVRVVVRNGRAQVVSPDMIRESMLRSNSAGSGTGAAALASIAARRRATDVRTLREANQNARPVARPAMTATAQRVAADLRRLREANQNAKPASVASRPSAVASTGQRQADAVRLLREANQAASDRAIVPAANGTTVKKQEARLPNGRTFITPAPTPMPPPASRTPAARLPEIPPSTLPRYSSIGTMPDMAALNGLRAPVRSVSPAPPMTRPRTVTRTITERVLNPAWRESVPAGTVMNTGSRDSVAQRTAGQATAANIQKYITRTRTVTEAVPARAQPAPSAGIGAGPSTRTAPGARVTTTAPQPIINGRPAVVRPTAQQAQTRQTRPPLEITVEGSRTEQRGEGSSAPAFQGTSTGRSYSPGQTYKTADGRTLQANNDGSFTNTDTGQRSQGSSGVGSSGRRYDAETNQWS